MSPTTKSEIINALAFRRDQVLTHLHAFDDASFMAGTLEVWGPAQHTAHLTLGHRRVARLLRAPKDLPKAAFAPRGYDATRDAYLEKLATVPEGLLTMNSSSGAFAEDATRLSLIEAYRNAVNKQIDSVMGWDEAPLDTVGFPHPIMGVLPVRDMLLFMLYHDLHHVNSMRGTLPR
jgi:hypothetical protein